MMRGLPKSVILAPAFLALTKATARDPSASVPAESGWGLRMNTIWEKAVGKHHWWYADGMIKSGGEDVEGFSVWVELNDSKANAVVSAFARGYDFNRKVWMPPRPSRVIEAVAKSMRDRQHEEDEATMNTSVKEFMQQSEEEEGLKVQAEGDYAVIGSFETNKEGKVLLVKKKKKEETKA